MSISRDDLRAAYEEGFRDGLESFAWMRDGVTYVGTTGKTLAEVRDNLNSVWNYHPEKVEP